MIINMNWKDKKTDNIFRNKEFFNIKVEDINIFLKEMKINFDEKIKRLGHKIEYKINKNIQKERLIKNINYKELFEKINKYLFKKIK